MFDLAAENRERAGRLFNPPARTKPHQRDLRVPFGTPRLANMVPSLPRCFNTQIGLFLVFSVTIRQKPVQCGSNRCGQVQ